MKAIAKSINLPIAGMSLGLSLLLVVALLFAQQSSADNIAAQTQSVEANLQSYATYHRLHGGSLLHPGSTHLVISQQHANGKYCENPTEH